MVAYYWAYPVIIDTMRSEILSNLRLGLLKKDACGAHVHTHTHTRAANIVHLSHKLVIFATSHTKIAHDVSLPALEVQLFLSLFSFLCSALVQLLVLLVLSR